MKTMQAQESIARSLQIAGTLLFVATLYLARDVLIPIALGMLVAFVLSPLVSRLQRLGISNSVAVFSAATLVVVILGLFIISIGSSVTGFTDDLPKHRIELKHKLENAKALAGGIGNRLREVTKVLGGADAEFSDSSLESEGETGPAIELPRTESESKDSDTNDGSSPNQPLFVVQKEREGFALKSWAGSATAVIGPLGTAGLVFVFAVFGLLYREDLRDRVVSVISQGNYVVTTEALNEASHRIGKYLIVQLVLNIAYGIAFTVGLMLIGFFLTDEGWFPYVAVLGTVAGIVRFVPYAGPLIGAALPLALSVLLFPGFAVFGAVLLLIAVMEIVFNNVFEPWLYGSSTGVSPLAVIVSAVFWGWLWGPIGLLLATPLTVCAVVLGQYVPRFRFLSVLLSDRVDVKPSVRTYQRLLGGQRTSVAEFLKSQRSSREPSQMIDQILVPTIKLITRDREQRSLSDYELMKLLSDSARDVGVGSESREDQASGQAQAEINSNDFANPKPESTEITKPRVVAVPVRHLGEQLVLEIVRETTAASIDLEVFENDDMPDRDAKRIAEQQPSVIVIAVIPPGGLEQVRYWCSAIRKSGFRGEIWVACLGKFKRYDRLLQFFRKNGADQLITSGQQLIQKLTRLAQRAKLKESVVNDAAEKCRLIEC